MSNGLQCYDLASMMDSGPLPYDALAHVYLAVIDRQTGEVMYVLDPWRYGGSCDLIPYDEDPNGGDPEEIVPWGVCEPHPADDYDEDLLNGCYDEEEDVAPTP